MPEMLSTGYLLVAFLRDLLHHYLPLSSLWLSLPPIISLCLSLSPPSAALKRVEGGGRKEWEREIGQASDERALNPDKFFFLFINWFDRLGPDSESTQSNRPSHSELDRDSADLVGVDSESGPSRSIWAGSFETDLELVSSAAESDTTRLSLRTLLVGSVRSRPPYGYY